MPTALLRAQTQTYTPAQIERVAKLSELYGHVKFFHPYLGYKRINWDSAFAQAAPRVAQAQTDAETVAAIGQLLAVLSDGATTVRLVGPRPKAAPGAASDSVQVYFAPDSVLVLQTNNYAGAGDYEGMIEKMGAFVAKLPKAHAVLLDLRGGKPLTDEQIAGFNYSLSYVRPLQLLSALPVVTAATRLRNHSGFAPEEGATSGGYWSGFYIHPGETTPPRKDSRSRPLAILVNKNAALTDGLLALGNHPHVRLYSAEPLTDAQVVHPVSFSFSPTITVDFRTSELLGADGSPGLSGVAQLPAGTRPEAAAAFVLSQLRTPAAASPTRSAGGNAALPTAPPSAAYATGTYPALGYRLLAGAKMWSVIHYFHAYKDLMPGSWDAALRTALGQLAAAPDSAEYALAVARFYRHIQDGHGFVSAPAIIRHVGQGGLPVEIRFVENKPVITRLFGAAANEKDLHVGDILTEVNGEKVEARIASLGAIQSASNEWTRLNYLRGRLLRAPLGKPIRVKVRGADNRERTVTLTAQPASELKPPSDTTAVFRLLPGNIGYADMGRLQSKDVPRMFAAFKTAKAVVFDMRNYPNGTAWAIAPYLTARKDVVGAKFFRYAPNEPDVTAGDTYHSMQKYFFDQLLPPNTGQPVYRGKTVMLVDERTQSQAEHSGLFFEAANGTEFIGSPTAGANGDVTSFAIPGGIRLSFSGHDVRHADGRQLQQVGLQPKILVRPTIQGIRRGQDEVLARALSYLANPQSAVHTGKTLVKTKAR
ncbi:S41 family peptidase [Hymenobacter glaciei]|uniref:S41 family peptidase n=1 Tax=Hymenobacter glaciei TaxID=877209 RepID=UPI0031E73952